MSSVFPADRFLSMKVLVHHEFRASKKEPFRTLVRRLHDGLAQTGEPVSFRFSFADSPAAGGVSAVNRAVKKFPQLAALITTEPLPGSAQPGPPTISGDQSNLPVATLIELAEGLPRSLPFHAAGVVFFQSGFGTAPSVPGSPTRPVQISI